MLKDCCKSRETREYHNNIAYHLSKAVIEKYINREENAEHMEMFDQIIHDLEAVFPSEDNQWNFMFERKLIELGFIHPEDKKLLKDLKKIYDERARQSERDRKLMRERKL